ncbi:hypothetical protein LSH36_281g10095 [Paralvinella palmiformis]|uniref:SOCS box domain-containing protein n=1 Tax=Paralvinella palmiformis TaxID=53620 RepID=A0AAD9JKL1_9ANNE|nr:hypothetical protein LSH36_281g10095 [Paralvinella palmiformis]
MVDINSKRESSGSSPLHELIHAVNRVPRGNGNLCEVDNSYLYSYDQNVIEGIQFLLEHGADVYAKDILGDSTLCVLLSNKNHLARCSLAARHDVPETSRFSLKSAAYGVDNVIVITELIIGHMDVIPTTSLYPASVVLKTLCSVDNDRDDPSLLSPFDVIERPGIVEKYTELLTFILRHFDPNRAMEGELPPLFYLLSQATLSPDADDYMYIISSNHCRHLVAFATVLLEHGANTEYDLLDTDGELLSYSCMDVLVYFLRKMQSYPHSRTAVDLLSLHELLRVVFTYGAKPYLYNTKFYHGPDFASAARVVGSKGASNIDATCTCTFLYQYLCFGAMNLQYVNVGDIYYEVLRLLADVTCQRLVYLAFQSARLVFTCMHGPVDCECGMCLDFHAMLESYMTAPRSLKQLCRLTIRDQTRHFSPRIVATFRLPKALADYILLLIM